MAHPSNQRDAADGRRSKGAALETLEIAAAQNDFTVVPGRIRRHGQLLAESGALYPTEVALDPCLESFAIDGIHAEVIFSGFAVNTNVERAPSYFKSQINTFRH